MSTPDLLIAVGRIAFGGFFVIAGVRNFLHFPERIAAQTNYGWPLPAPLVALGFAVQLVGGLAVLLDIWTAVGAASLIAFTAIATALFHNLFLFHGKERDPHLYLTLVNITLCAGLLAIIGQAMA